MLAGDPQRRPLHRTGQGDGKWVGSDCAVCAGHWWRSRHYRRRIQRRRSRAGLGRASERRVAAGYRFGHRHASIAAQGSARHRAGQPLLTVEYAALWAPFQALSRQRPVWSLAQLYDDANTQPRLHNRYGMHDGNPSPNRTIRQFPPFFLTAELCAPRIPMPARSAEASKFMELTSGGNGLGQDQESKKRPSRLINARNATDARTIVASPTRPWPSSDASANDGPR